MPRVNKWQSWKEETRNDRAYLGDTKVFFFAAWVLGEWKMSWEVGWDRSVKGLGDRNFT